jgi:SnoaL-like domain
MPDIAARVRNLEDRALISEVIIRYAMGIDRRNWSMFADCFTDPVDTDYSERGHAAKTWARDEFVALVRARLSGFAGTQHISPNHVIDFDEADPDRAICYSYMYAHHLLQGSKDGDLFLAVGHYTNHMRRSVSGWRIERIIQHVDWQQGNRSAVEESSARFAGPRDVSRNVEDVRPCVWRA